MAIFATHPSYLAIQFRMNGSHPHVKPDRYCAALGNGTNFEYFSQSELALRVSGPAAAGYAIVGFLDIVAITEVHYDKSSNNNEERHSE